MAGSALLPLDILAGVLSYTYEQDGSAKETAMDEQTKRLIEMGMTEEQARGLAGFLATEEDGLTVAVRDLPEPSSVDWRTTIVPLTTREATA